MDETKKNHSLNKHYREKLEVTNDVPTIFIDPILPIFSNTKRNQRKIRRQPEAVEKFKNETSRLWKLSTAKQPFNCEENCRAPSGFYSGAPLVAPSVVRGKTGTKQRVLCQISKGIAGKGSKTNMKWKFNEEVIF